MLGGLLMRRQVKRILTACLCTLCSGLAKQSAEANPIATARQGISIGEVWLMARLTAVLDSIPLSSGQSFDHDPVAIQVA